MLREMMIRLLLFIFVHSIHTFLSHSSVFLLCIHRLSGGSRWEDLPALRRTALSGPGARPLRNAPSQVLSTIGRGPTLVYL